MSAPFGSGARPPGIAADSNASVDCGARRLAQSAPDLPSSHPLEFLTQAELAARWRLSGRTLERWRTEAYGPPWIVLGGSVRYPVRDILAYEARHRCGPSDAEVSV